jgi:hypothetical protein
MVMTATVMSQSEFESVLARIEERLRQANQEGQQLVSTVRRWANLLGPFADDLDAILDWIVDLLVKIGRTIFEFITQPGVPWTLWNHGSDWSGPPIAGRISAQIAKSTLDQTRVDDFWQGPAADAYKNTLPRQKEALAKLVGYTKTIDDVLTRMAIAIGAFWLAILTGIIALVVELMGEGAAATTGVGAPPAAAGAAVSLVKFLGIVSASLDVFYVFVMANTLPAIKDLHQDVSDASAFPDGQWPHPSIDLADASLSDGDPTDWHLRTNS